VSPSVTPTSEGISGGCPWRPGLLRRSERPALSRYIVPRLGMVPVTPAGGVQPELAPGGGVERHHRARPAGADRDRVDHDRVEPEVTENYFCSLKKMKVPFLAAVTMSGFLSPFRSATATCAPTPELLWMRCGVYFATPPWRESLNQ
jgi:hypothetical protein